MATKLQFKLEIFFYYLKKNIPYIFGLIIISALVFSQRTVITHAYNRVFHNDQVIGVEGFYTEKNLPDFITKDISMGLTQIQENGKTINSPLIESMVIENENLDYIFTLKEGFVWHNGKELQASDIVIDINGVTTSVLDKNQLKVSVTAPFAPLTTSLAKPLLKKNLVGLGSYKVEKVEYQDGYLKKMKLVSLVPEQKNKVYKFFPSERDVVNAYKLGEIETAFNLTSQYDFTKWPKTKITTHILSNQKYIAIFFNTDKISEKQTRQALAYATPKTIDKNERCLGPISPQSWAYNNTVKEYNYNPTRAKELFNKDSLAKINLSVVDRRLLPQAELIKTAWHDSLGIDVNISVENQFNSDNFEAVIAYASIPSDPDQYIYWHSTQTNGNITHLNNSRIDKLLEDGRQTFDPIERKKIYLDFQRYLLEESPAVFISYPSSFTIDKTQEL